MPHTSNKGITQDQRPTLEREGQRRVQAMTRVGDPLGVTSDSPPSDGHSVAAKHHPTETKTIQPAPVLDAIPATAGAPHLHLLPEWFGTTPDASVPAMTNELDWLSELLRSNEGTDDLHEDDAAEISFAYAQDILYWLLDVDTDTKYAQTLIREDMRTFATPVIEWITNEATAIAHHALTTLCWFRDIPPLSEAVERLTREGLLAPSDQALAIRWLADLAWWGSERLRVGEQARDRDAQRRWAEIALIMALAALRDLPDPAGGLDDYVVDTWDC